MWFLDLKFLYELAAQWKELQIHHTRTVHRSNWSNQMPVQKSKPLVRPYRDGRRPRSKAPTGGRPETVEQRRERIVRMAAPLFLEKGYDNVSIDQIIGVVGGLMPALRASRVGIISALREA